MLATSCEVKANLEDRVLSKEEMVSGVRGCEGILCLLTDRVDAEIMDAGNLRVISNYAMGYDNIDLEAANQRRILVTNTPVDGLKETPADFTFALLLSLARRVCDGNRTVRDGAFSGWSPTLLLGSDVYGKTIGIVGAGRIGSAVARRAMGFGMRILYCGPHRKEELERDTGAERVSQDELLTEADFVTLHLPLTPETRGMIGERELAEMKRTAFLINTSRGAVLDEKALSEALLAGRIAGAAVDVFEEEPAIHPELLRMSNVLLTPHMASASLETRTEMAVVAAQNLLEALAGRTPRHLVNKEVLSSQGGE